MSILVEANTRCCKCGAAREVRQCDQKPAKGWMQVYRGRMVCPDCVPTYCVTRTASIPVHSVVNLDFKEFEAHMLQQFSVFTDAANWLLHEYEIRDPGLNAAVRKDPVAVFAACSAAAAQEENDANEEEEEKVTDHTRHNLIEKLPDYKQPDFYKAVRDRFPSIASRSVTCLLKRMWKTHYMKLRYGVIVYNNLPARVGYPYPILIRADGLKLEFRADETGEQHPHLAFVMGEQDVVLRLCDNMGYFARQISLLEKVQKGGAKLGDLTLFLQESKPGAKDKHKRIRVGSGSQRSFRILICNVAVTFPNEPTAAGANKRPDVKPNKILFVRMSPNALYTMTCDGHTLFRRHDSHVVNLANRTADPRLTDQYLLDLIKRREARSQELSEDKKGANSNQRRRIAKKSRQESLRYAERLASHVFLHAKAIVDTAIRHQCGRVVVNASPNRITDAYRWFALFNRIKDNCAEKGIVYDQIEYTSPDGAEYDDKVVYNNVLKERERAQAKAALRRLKSREAAEARREKNAHTDAAQAAENNRAATEVVLDNAK